MSEIVLIVVGVAGMAWLAVLFVSSIRGGEEEVAPNLSPFLSNEELETVRMDRTLGVSVVLVGFLAVSIPLYFLTETNRQARFEDTFLEESIIRGEEHFEDPAGCAQCHGGGGVGGAAATFEPRSGVATNWAAPPLNDIFYRYDREEVKFWIVYGRAGSPMPAWGLEGGGAFNDQEVEDILNYMVEIQLPLNQVIAIAVSAVSAAGNLLAGADATIEATLADQQEQIDVANSAPALKDDAARIGAAATNLIEGLPEDYEGEPSQAPEGVDTDRDGLTDEAENRLPALIDEALALGFANFDGGLAPIDLDPRNPMTNGIDQDLDVATEQVGYLSNAVLLIRVTADNLEKTLEPLESGLAWLEASQTNKLWEVDTGSLAVADPDRAVNLFNANCARCHTAGWSSGTEFANPIGSGGFGPSLQPPRARLQFTSPDDLRDFLYSGSESGVGYGVSGIGRGYMPGFGASLTAEDVDLIVDYLWGETLGGPDVPPADATEEGSG